MHSNGPNLIQISPPIQQPTNLHRPEGPAAAAAWIGHRNWQNEPGVPAGRRNPAMEHARVGTDIVSDYEDRWDLFGTPTDKVPIMLPKRYRELAADPSRAKGPYVGGRKVPHC